MSSISFFGLEKSENGFTIGSAWGGDGAGRGDLEFEFDQPVNPSSASIATALSTLCGRAYHSIDFDFAVPDSTLEQVRRFTLADVSARRGAELPGRLRKGNLLSFSGGFDSLAALALMPNDTTLVATDFGGRFARERAFFSRFEPLTMSTNLTEFPLRKNSWSFMGIASILASDYVGARFMTFGSVLQDGANNLSRQPAVARNSTFPPFASAGYRNAPYVLGLPEGAILRILLQYRPNLISDSFASLAGPGEEKQYRKFVQIKLASDIVGTPVSIPEVARPARPHYAWGEIFLIDILSLYVISKTGMRDAAGLVRDIPERVVDAALALPVGFMEKANPTVYQGFPDELYAGLASRLAEYGIRWYDESDWEALAQARRVLGPYHPAILK